VKEYRITDRQMIRYEELQKDNPLKPVLEEEASILQNLLRFYTDHPEIPEHGYNGSCKTCRTKSVWEPKKILMAMAAVRLSNNAWEHTQLGIRMKRSNVFSNGRSSRCLDSLRYTFEFESKNKPTGPLIPVAITRSKVLFVMDCTMRELNVSLTPLGAAGAVLSILVACGIKEDPQGNWVSAVKSIQSLINKSKKSNKISPAQS
jgi:hypothetical protein